MNDQTMKAEEVEAREKEMMLEEVYTVAEQTVERERYHARLRGMLLLIRRFEERCV